MITRDAIIEASQAAEHHTSHKSHPSHHSLSHSTSPALKTPTAVRLQGPDQPSTGESAGDGCSDIVPSPASPGAIERSSLDAIVEVLAIAHSEITDELSDLVGSAVRMGAEPGAAMEIVTALTRLRKHTMLFDNTLIHIEKLLRSEPCNPRRKEGAI